MRLKALAGSLFLFAATVAAGATTGLDGDGRDLGSAPSAEAAARTDPPHVSCSEAIVGKGAKPKRGRDLIAGPVAFVGLRKHADHPKDFERTPGKRYAGVKSGAVVDRGAVVTIIVPKSERPQVKIDYKLGERPVFAETLEACNGKRTGFPGGFKVHGPRCSKLRILVEGRARPLKRRVSFGAGSCRSG